MAKHSCSPPLKRWATQSLHAARNASRGSGTSTVVGILLLLALALATGAPALAQDRQAPIKIGVLAKRGAERCLEKWGPTAEYLTSEIPGYFFTILPLGYDEIDAAVERAEVDFILANPSLYATLDELHGANRIATLKNRHAGDAHTVFGGVIFRRADRDDIQGFDDLKGKTFMAVKETSLGGWRTAWRELKERGIDPHRDFHDLTFGGTHDAVVYAVRDGKVDAGTVQTDTLEEMVAEGKIRLEDCQVIHEHGVTRAHAGAIDELPFLHSTRVYPEWPMARLAHTSDELAEKVAVALIAMPPDCPAAKAARCAGWTVPLNYQPVHDCLKELRVGPYRDYGKVTLWQVFEQYWPFIAGAAALAVIGLLVTLHVTRLNARLHESIAAKKREIAERNEAEGRLRESEERHRVITEAAQDAIITADAEGNIGFWNSAAEEIFGFSAAEVVGKKMMELIVPPQYHEAKRKGLAEFAHAGRGAAVGQTLELTALRKGGTEFPIEISLSGYKGTDGFTAVAVVRDITERSRAKAERQRMHAESRQLLESIPSLMIAVDANDKVTAWNGMAERVFGIEAKDAVGRSLDDLDIQWDWPAVTRSMAECRANSRPVRLDDVRFKRIDGTEGFLGITLNPIRGDADQRAGFLLFAADITEQKILQYQLAQSQKLESIGQLAAGIAHEINTPTQFVGDNTRFLQDAFGDLQGLLDKYARLAEAGRTGSMTPEILAKVDAATKEADLEYLKEQIPQAITQALDGVERVAKIVRAMKDFSHPSGEGMEAVDLNRAIESTVTVARNEWKYVAELVADFDPALPSVVCQIGDFNQVILNIVINAAHAIAGVVGNGAGGKGTITVSTRHDGDWAEIRIRDTGTGIPEEHRAKVFDHFFTTKEVGKGTGQGLSIAHAVVTEKHGGTITFETEMGKGTTFIIRLPIEHKRATPKETPHHEEAHSLC